MLMDSLKAKLKRAFSKRGSRNASRDGSRKTSTVGSTTTSTRGSHDGKEALYSVVRYMSLNDNVSLLLNHYRTLSYLQILELIHPRMERVPLNQT